jgi:hypothetical protein
MDSRRLLVAAALALSASVPSSALAAPSPAQRETARRLMDEGKERTRAGEKERAVDAYRKAHDLMKVPTTGLALARAHLSMGHLVEARDVALEVGRMTREKGEPPVFEKARREASYLETSLKARIPTVRIVVKGGPATKVTIDDVEVAPLLLGEPVAVNPGKHVVAAKNADGAEERTDVELAERDGKEVGLTLPIATPAVVSVPETGPTNAESATTTSESAGAGSERSTGASVLVYGGFGLAVAGLAVGGITGALTLSKASTVKPQCERSICDPAAKTDLDGANSMATISTIGFAVAGAGAVVGLVGLLLPRTKTEAALTPERRAAVWVGPGSMGLRGTF